MPRLFISHAGADRTIALALGRWLEQQGLGDYFLAVKPEKGIAAGLEWRKALDRRVRQCDAVLLLLSPEWLRSFECRHEFVTAQVAEKLWFVIMIRPLAEEPVDGELKLRQLCDLTPGTRSVSFVVEDSLAPGPTTVRLSAEGLEHLYRGLCAAGLDASTFVWPPPDDPDRCPYPGLRALDESDAGVFFGRGAQLVDAIDAMHAACDRGGDQLFVVLGASGAGKSSFIRAGVLPRLRRDTQRFVVLPVVRPERAVIEGTNGLLSSLRTALKEAGCERGLADIRDRVDAGNLAALVDEIAASATACEGADGGCDRFVVLPIDQAEELFADEAQYEAVRFGALMESLLFRSGPSDSATRAGILVVLTIRTDALSRLQQQSFARRPQLFSLPPMPATEFKSVIEGPARRQSQGGRELEITPGLADELARDALQLDSLPLLAMTLESLYREYAKETKVVLGVDEYRRLGKMETVIVNAVERALSDPAGPSIPARKDDIDQTLNRIFPLLATIDPESKSFKRRVAARAAFHAIPYADALIERLVDQRLLEADCRRLPGTMKEVDVVEVAHETVIVHWKAFARWLTEYKGSLINLELVCRAAEDWNSHDRDPDLLVHTGHRRSVAVALLTDERVGVRVTPVERRYLDACSRRDWVRRAIGGTFGIASVVGFAFFGLAARDEARQKSLTLANAAESAIREDDFEQARRLAVLATRNDWLHPVDDSALPRLARAAGGNTARVVEPHPAAVRAVAISADGRRMLTTADDNASRLFDLSTGLVIGQPMQHEGPIEKAAFSPDGREVVTASSDKTARLWDAATGAPLSSPLRHVGAVRDARFSADGTMVVTASDDMTVRLWDARNGRSLAKPMVHDSAVVTADFGPDGKRVVTVSGQAIRVWDVHTAEPIGDAMVPPTTITGASFSPDGKWVAAILQKSADVWDLERHVVVEPRIEHDDRIRAAGFSPDSKRIVTASDDRTARIWDIGGGSQAPGSAILQHPGAVHFAAFSADGHLVLTGSADHRARVWSGGELVGDPLPHRGVVNDGRFSDDGLHLVTASLDKTARIWDLDAIRRRAGPLMRREAPMTAAEFGPDGSQLVTASVDGSAQLWDVGKAEAIGDPMANDGAVGFVAFSPDGLRVATVSNRDEVILWDQPGREETGAWQKLPGPVMAIRFVGQALRVVISRNHEKVAVLDGATGKPFGPDIELDSELKSADIAPDGSKIVTGSAFGSAQLWDVASGQQLDEVKHETWVQDASFSPDSRCVLTVSGTTTRIWGGSECALARPPKTYAERIGSARFSPDGLRFVTTSVLGDVRVWDARTGQPLDEPRPGAVGFASAAFSPDGTKLVTGTPEGAARVWSVAWSSLQDADRLRRAVCAGMTADARRISEADRQLASSAIRPSEIGRDVCASVGPLLP